MNLKKKKDHYLLFEDLMSKIKGKFGSKIKQKADLKLMILEKTLIENEL